jgi:HAD superfamily hydrolase (TIGR01509 family)
MNAIVFDADGVLIGGKDKLGKYLWQKNIETDLGLSPDQVDQIYTGGWSLVLKGLVDSRQYFKSMFAKLNIGLSVDEFVEYWLKTDSTINTEILPVLESIKGPKLYIGTNQDRRRTKIIQEKFEPYFDKIFSSYQIGAIKPEDEFYKYIESDLKLQVKDIAFIDDSKSHIDSAARLGWTCHHYKTSKNLRILSKNCNYIEENHSLPLKLPNCQHGQATSSNPDAYPSS